MIKKQYLTVIYLFLVFLFQGILFIFNIRSNIFTETIIMFLYIGAAISTKYWGDE